VVEINQMKRELIFVKNVKIRLLIIVGIIIINFKKITRLFKK
jgi:hypothetical protein